jgi:hypothetical protein
MSSQLISVVFILFPTVQIALPYKRMGRVSALYTFIPKDFWTKFGLKVFRIPGIKENFTDFY